MREEEKRESEAKLPSTALQIEKATESNREGGREKAAAPRPDTTQVAGMRAAPGQK